VRAATLAQKQQGAPLAVCYDALSKRMLHFSEQGGTRSMAGYMIDTAAAIDGLRAEGLPPNQARAIVRTIAQRNEEIATKSDIVAVKGDIAAVKGDIAAVKGDIVALKSDIRRLESGIVAVKGDVVSMRNEMKSDIRALESRLNTKIYLMAGTIVAALKALQYLGL